MSKILLVEDDNNLREIYEARLQAEGYEIVSARDGEEALTVAMKERPDLIISDVMMPKISGFDMLDIIRSTEETKNVKVIMMTALSQAEDKARAEKLGADRYLVKSQVTLEDVAKVAREVLSGESQPVSETTTVSPTPPPAPAVEVLTPAPVVTPPAQIPELTPAPSPITILDDTASSDANPALSAVVPEDASSQTTSSPLADEDIEQAAIVEQIESFIDSKKTGTATPEPVAPVATETASNPAIVEPKDDASEASQSGKKVIQPISDPTASKELDLNKLLEREKDKEAMAEIARNLGVEKADVADELSAEAALRSAARNTENAVPVTKTDSEVNITEDGDLKVKEAPTTTAPVDETPTVDTSDVPVVTEAPLTISAPPSTGTNIDGVVPTTPVTPAEKPTSSGVDPDSIAL